MADLSLHPDIVEEHVRKLNRQADSFSVGSVVIGLVAGAAIGGMPLVAHGAIPSKFGIATLLLGALLGGVLGHMLGSARSFGYRLRAQQALGQLRLEQNVEALLAAGGRGAPVAVETAPVEPEQQLLPDLTPAFEWPTVEREPELSLAELDETTPEPEPEPSPDILPAAWAAVLEHALSPVTAQPAPVPAFEPEPIPEPEAMPEPTWSLPSPVVEEQAPAFAGWSDPVEVVPAPTPEYQPQPQPEYALMPAARATEEAEIDHPSFGTTTPPWAVPMVAPDPEPAAAAAETPVVTPPTPPAAPSPVPDLSTMSIAEIARLADAGSI